MHRPRKRFGQNFLRDQNIIDKIIELINPDPHDCMLEIGPGQGAITNKLLARVKKLIAVEIDSNLAGDLLKRYPDLVLFNEDALKFDLDKIECRPLRIVGNLPYNISSPLLFKFLQHKDKVQDMHFMLQQELVDRMTAGSGNKTYGRLSVMVQAYCEAEPLIKIKPSAFFPKPKVDSAIVRLIPKTDIEIQDHEKFAKLVKAAFCMRRKTLRNNLKNLIQQNLLDTGEFDLSLRAEDLTVKQYLELYEWYQLL